MSHRVFRRRTPSAMQRVGATPVESLESRRLMSVTPAGQSADAAPGDGPAAGTDGTGQVFVDVRPGAAETDGETTQGTLAPTVFGALPTSAVAGAKVKGASATVTVTNVAPDAYSGPVTVTLYISTNATFESGADPRVAAVTKKLKIDSADAKSLRLKIPSFPLVPDGDYVLIAQVTSPTVAPGTSSNDESVRIAAPFVDLFGSFGALPATLTRGRRGRLTLTLSNAGNVDARGAVPVTIATSADASGANPTTVATVNAKLSVKSSASKPLKLSFTLPAEVPAGTFFLVATLGSPASPTDNDLTNNMILSTTALTIA